MKGGGCEGGRGNGVKCEGKGCDDDDDDDDDGDDDDDDDDEFDKSIIIKIKRILQDNNDNRVLFLEFRV